MADRRVVFILRLWAEVGPEERPSWRGSLQQAGKDHIRYFTSLAQAVEFIKEASGWMEIGHPTDLLQGDAGDV